MNENYSHPEKPKNCDDGIFGLFPRRPLVPLPLFLLQAKKKKRKICGRGKNVGLGLAKVSFFANRLASSFLFCGFIGILDTGSPLTLHTFLFDTMNTHITLTLFIYLSIYLRPSTCVK